MADTLNPTIAAITTQTVAYTPAVLAAVQAAELSNANGTTKLQSVVTGVLGATQVLEAAPNPNVAAVAALTNLVVGILNSLGVFNHKTAPPQAVA